MIALMLLGTFFVALGFNTVDQMIIRYKYYEDWRNNEMWEMTYWFKPNWWDMYITSVIMLIFGGICLGIDTALLLKKGVADRW